MTEFQHRFAHTNGIRMHYVEAGAGPTVVLCHGFPESWYSWRHQLRALAEAGFRAIAPDQRGYGETDAPVEVEAYGLCQLTGDIVGLLYDLGVSNAVIVGHDWGAPVAWTTALLRPDLITGVALLSVPYLQGLWGGPPPTEAMRAMVGDQYTFYQLYFQEEGVAEAELAEDPARSLSGIYYAASAEGRAEGRVLGMFPKTERFIDNLPRAPRLPAWLDNQDFDYFVQQFEKSGFRGPVNWYRNLDRNGRMLSFLKNAKVQQPAVFLAGEHDAVVNLYRKAYDELETTMPKLRQKILAPGAGHSAQQAQPEAASRALVEFCRHLQARGAAA